MDASNAAAVQLMVHSSRLFRLMDGSTDIATEKMVKEGQLTKQGAIHKTWKTRWFCVTATGCVLYFKSQKGFPLGGFVLFRATVLLSENELIVKSPVSYTMSKGQAEEAKDRVFKMKAKDLNELKAWEAALVNVQAGGAESRVVPALKPVVDAPAQWAEDAPATLVSPPISPRGSARPASPLISPRTEAVPSSPRVEAAKPPSPRPAPAPRPPVSPRERPVAPPRKSGVSSPSVSPRRSDSAASSVPEEVTRLHRALVTLQDKFNAASDAELTETGDALFASLALLRDEMLPLHNKYRAEGFTASSVQLWRALNEEIPARINTIKNRRPVSNDPDLNE